MRRQHAAQATPRSENLVDRSRAWGFSRLCVERVADPEDGDGLRQPLAAGQVRQDEVLERAVRVDGHPGGPERHPAVVLVRVEPDALLAVVEAGVLRSGAGAGRSLRKLRGGVRLRAGDARRVPGQGARRGHRGAPCAGRTPSRCAAATVRGPTSPASCQTCTWTCPAHSCVATAFDRVMSEHTGTVLACRDVFHRSCRARRNPRVVTEPRLTACINAIIS